MRVLHAAAEIAGQPALLCRGLRRLGIEAQALSFQRPWQGYKSDIELDGAGFAGLWRRLRALLVYGPRLDILHLHFGTSFLPRMLDVPWLHRRGTRLVFHFHGCDIRPRAEMLARHAVSACTECPVYCSPVRQARLARLAARHGALCLVSTPDLLEVAPGAVHLPVAIDVEAWTAERRRARPAPGFVVLHAPSEPLIKGTHHVEAAVAALAGARSGVRLLEVAGRPLAEARRLYGQAAVAVDQLQMGWHGLFAVEAMLLGLPVACFIRDDLRALRPALPVVPTSRESLFADLARLYDQPHERRRLGAAGIAYASGEHGLERVSRELARLYEARVLGAQVA